MEQDRRSPWILVPRSTQKVTPWRNGGGSTREIAIDPPQATVAGAFRWRVSSAPILSGGPFSRFLGVDRSLWLIEGNGIEFTIDGAKHRLTRPLQQIDFAGEDSVSAELLDGPVVDLNVMFARAHVQARTAIVANSNHAFSGNAHCVIVALGPASLRIQGQQGLKDFALADGDALRAELPADQRATIEVRGTVLCAEFGV
jgi:environmental stress-induced protein Ves